jgi:integrase
MSTAPRQPDPVNLGGDRPDRPGSRLLLDAAAGHRFELIIISALAYGMRRGEVLGSRWSALGWDAGTLQVTHGVQRIKSREQQPGHRTQLIVGELKTRRSRRSLALTTDV